MIYASLIFERIVQVDDVTRLDVSRSFVTPDSAPIATIEISPEDMAPFIDVTSSMYLDYAYSTAGDKTVTVKITLDDVGNTVSEKEFELTVLTVEEDNLFSNDFDLLEHEGNILEYLRRGRVSYVDKHRAAQKYILNELDARRIWSSDGTRITKEQVTDIQEVRSWAKFLALKFIFEELSNAIDDIFAAKSIRYDELAKEAGNRSALKLDFSNNGEATARVDTRSMRLVRR